MTHLLRSCTLLLARRPRTTITAVVAAVAAAVAGAVAGGGAFIDDFRVPGIEAQRAQDLLAERFRQRSGDEATVVFRSPRGKLTASRRRASIEQALRAIARQPHVERLTGPFRAGHLASDKRTAFATVAYDREADQLGAPARRRLEAAIAGLPRAGVTTAMAGRVIDAGDTGAAPVGEIAGVLVALFLLLGVLRSLRATLSALAATLVGLALGFALMLLAATVTDVPTLAPTLAAMLGLGAGIDYALLLAARHQEELRARRRAPAIAAAEANATAGASALTAAGIVAASIAGLLVAGVPFVGRVGVAAGTVVLACAAVCVVLLPALLAAAGERALPRAERRRSAGDYCGDVRGPRHRASVLRAFPSRHPRAALIMAGAVLAMMAAPAVRLELGQPDDGNRPPDTTQRQAYDALAAAFGPGFNGPLVVAVGLPRGGDQDIPQRLATRIARDPAIAQVDGPVVNPDRTAATISAVPHTAPQDERTAQLVQRLRASTIPAVVEGSGAQAFVGGPTARYGDEAARIASRIPVFALAVVGLSLVLLRLAFRSWRIAAVSAAFNLVSIAASYGVVTLAFQTQTGAELLGVAEQPVVPYVPLFMFAIVFGLSTDYNVFLLSRVREEWRRGRRDMPVAVHAASSSISRVISAAGAIMVAVFLGFATDPESTIKMAGVGLAAAVAVDVTLVRLVLAPAALTLMGDKIWRRDCDPADARLASARGSQQTWPNLQ